MTSVTTLRPDVAICGLAHIDANRVTDSVALQTFLADGAYNATEWFTGDLISAQRMNKIEDGLFWNTYYDKMSVDTYEQLNDIDITYISEGVNLAYVKDEDKFYYYTTEKQWQELKTGGADISSLLKDYAKKSDIPTKLSQLINDKGYLSSIPSQYITESELSEALDNVSVDLDGYATEEYVDDKLQNLDLAEYAKLADLEGLFDDVEYNEEESTNDQTALDFYSKGKKVKTVHFKGGSGGGSAYISTALPENAMVGTGENFDLILDFASANQGPGTLKVFINDVDSMSTRIEQGESTTIIPSNLFSKGTNKVVIYVLDRTGAMSNSLTFYVRYGSTEITSDFDPYTWYDYGAIVRYYFTPIALDTSLALTFYMSIDGEVKPGVNCISDTRGYYTFPMLSVGNHKCRAWVQDSNGDISNVLTFNLIILDEVSLAVASDTETVTIEEGDQLSLDYRVYMKNNYSFITKVYIDNNLITTGTCGLETNYYKNSALSQGTHTVKIEVWDLTETKSDDVIWTVNITESTYVMKEPVTSGATFIASAANKTNADEGREAWVGTNQDKERIEVPLVNFSWNNESGWIDDQLIFSGNSYAEIPIKPLADNAKYGFTLDIEFLTKPIGVENALVLDLWDEENNCGIKITTEELIMQSRAGNSCDLYFEENEIVSAMFIIDRHEKTAKIYLNGVMCEAFHLSDYEVNGVKYLEDFTVDKTIKLGGKGYSAIRNIRVYQVPLTTNEIINNFIANKILKFEQKELVEFQKGNDLPTMTIYCDFSGLGKDDKKPCNIAYLSTDVNKYGESFTLDGKYSQLQYQGTSSMAYPIKNYRINPRDKDGKKKINPFIGGQPESRFTLKADFITSNHAHNTGMAKFISDKLYNYNDEDEKTMNPMRWYLLQNGKDVKSVRETINGFPIRLILVNDGETALNEGQAEPVPGSTKDMGIFNFNNDKDNLNSMGMDTKIFPNCISYEVTANSDTSAGAFVPYTSGSGKTELEYLQDSFELRYPDADDVGKDYGYLNMNGDATKGLKRVIDWVGNCTDEEFIADFEKYFNKHYTLRYYLLVVLMAGVDNLGKNMMLDSWDGQIWYPRFYDIDTILSYDNSGEIKFDVDIEMEQGYWNTSNSRLWTKVRDLFHDELIETYKNMRANGVTYEGIMKYMYDEQIARIPQSYYNQDYDVKYAPYADQYLGKAHGDGLQHMKRWLKKRFIFCDTLFDYAPSYENDILTIRANTLNQMNITIETYTPLYQHVSFYNGNMEKIKVKPGEPITFSGYAQTETDQEVLIYGGSNIKSITGLATTNPNSMLIGSATRLTELDISNCPILTIVNSNKANFSPHVYLNKLNISNCPQLGGNLNISNSPLLQEVNASGSGITGVLMPTSARNIEKLRLPNTLKTLTLNDVPLLHTLEFDEGLEMESISISNCNALENYINFDLTQIQNVYLDNAYDNEELYMSATTNLTLMNMPTLQRVIYTPNSEYETFNIADVINGKSYKITTFNNPNMTDFIVTAPHRLSYNCGKTEIVVKPGGKVGDTYELLGDSYLAGFWDSNGNYSTSAELWNYPITLPTKGYTTLTISYSPASTRYVRVTQFNGTKFISRQLIDNVYGVIQQVTISPDCDNIYFVCEEPRMLSCTCVLLSDIEEEREMVEGYGDVKPNTVFTANTLDISDTQFTNVKLLSTTDVYNLKVPTTMKNFYCDSAFDIDTDVIEDASYEIIHNDLIEPYTTNYGNNVLLNGEIPNIIPSSANGSLIFHMYSNNTIQPTSTSPYIWDLTGLKLNDFYTYGMNNWIKQDDNGNITMPQRMSDYSVRIVNADITPNQYATHLYPLFINTTLPIVGKIDYTKYQGNTLAWAYAYTTGDVTINPLPSKQIATQITNDYNKLYSTNYIDTVEVWIYKDKDTSKLSANNNITSAYIELTSNNYQTRIDEVIEVYPNCTELYLFEDGSVTALNNLLYNKTSSSKVTKIEFMEGYFNALTSLSDAFSGCRALTTILNIPNSVTNINNVFQNCSNLITVSNFPNNVITMSGAFQGCSKITIIPNMPNSATNMNFAFYGCSSLTAIPNIPTSATNINSAFRGCTKLTSIPIIPDSVTTMTYAFYGCSSLTSVANIPNRITSLTNTFRGCTNLTSVPTIPNGVTNMDSAFQSCSKLVNVPNIPNNVTNMNYAFHGCSSLVNAPSIPDKVTNLTATFHSCSALQNAYFRLSATSYTSCFTNCSKLSNITWLGERTTNFSLTTLGAPSYTQTDVEELIEHLGEVESAKLTLGSAGSFLGTQEIISLGKKGWETDALSGDFAIVVANKDVSELSTDANKTAVMIELTNSNYKTRVNEVLAYYPNGINIHFFDDGSVTTLENLFNNNNTTYRSNIKTITFLEGYFNKLTNMKNTFNGCSKLTQAPTIPNSVANMTNAFQNCTALTTPPTIPNGVTNMSGIFYNCISLTTPPNIPNGVTNMSSTFNGCRALTQAPNIPNSVANMSNAFQSCISLTQAPTIPNSVTNMSYTFYSCSKLTTPPNIPNSVTNMSSTFQNCTSLTQAPNIPNSVANMSSTFQNCRVLTQAPTIGNSVTNMAYTFHGCSSLTQAPAIPNSVTDMQYTFYGCTALTTVDLNGFDPTGTTFTSIFDGCTSLKTVRIDDWTNQELTQAFVNLLPAVTPTSYVCTDLMVTVPSGWKVISLLFAKYTSTSSGVVPTFNSEYTGYTTNEVNNGNGTYTTTIRTNSVDNLPTQISFSGKYTLTSVEYLDVTNVNAMYGMFSGCFDLVSVNTSNWDTSNATNMYQMFDRCSKLTSLDLSSFNTSKVEDMGSMFYYCTSLTSLDISSFDMSKVTNTGFMFASCSALKELHLENIQNSTHVQSICNALPTVSPTSYVYASYPVTVPSGWVLSLIVPDDVIAIYIATNSGLIPTFNSEYTGYTTSEVNNGNGTYTTTIMTNSVDNLPTQISFKNKSTLTSVEYLNTKNLTTMKEMFYGCNKLTSLDLSNFNTSNVRDMSNMFSRCSALTSLDLSSFNTSKVTDMYYMFYNCSGLTSLNLSSFNTSNVTDMYSMFYGCNALTSLDLSSFDVSKVTDMYSMFDNCSSLVTLYSMKNIGVNLDFKNTKLNATSLLDVINNLKTVSRATLTLGSTLLAKLTNAQKAIATNKGWTLA